MTTVRPRRSPTVQIAAGVVVVAQLVVSVLGAWARPDLYDQGTYLASARFVAEGLVPYRDFGHPYGPGLPYVDAVVIWLGLDSLPAHRLLWGAGSVALTVMVLAYARRKDRLAVGVVVAAVLLIAPIKPTYLVPALCVVAATVVLDKVPSRTLVASCLLAVAAWFRFEYLLLLALFLLAVFVLSTGSRVRSLVHGAGASALAFAPYVLLVGLGALPGLRTTLEYALHDFPRYRGLPYPWTSPLSSAADLVSGDVTGAADQAARAIGYLVVPFLVVVVVAAAALRARAEGRSTRSAFAGPVVWLALLFFVFCLYTLRVRADTFHSAPIILAGGVVVVCLGLGGVRDRVTWLRVGAPAVAALLAALSVGRALTGLGGADPLLEQAVAEARGYVQPGDPLFVANIDNSLTYINAPYLYWALAATPASPVTSFDPGYADQEATQRVIVEDLCRVQPVVVLWDAPSTRDLAGLAFSDRLDDHLATAYRPVFENAEFSVLVPRAGGC